MKVEIRKATPEDVNDILKVFGSSEDSVFTESSSPINSLLRDDEILTDPVFNSYYMGTGPRDPDLFPDITEQLALSPKEILLVDDIKSNVERAQAAGWQAIHYVDKASFLEMMDKILQSDKQEK